MAGWAGGSGAPGCAPGGCEDPAALREWGSPFQELPTAKSPHTCPMKVPQSISSVCAVCPQLVPKCRKSSVGPGEGCISVGQKTVCRGRALAALALFLQEDPGDSEFGRLDGKFGMLLSPPPCQSLLSASWESTSVPDVC